MLEVDELKLWRGKPLVINDKIKVFQPTIDEIIDMGEREYFSAIQMICSTSSNMKAQLDSMGLDWEQIEDFQMFIMLTQNLKPEQTHLVLGDLDLSKFKPHENKQNGEIVLVDIENDIVIDRLIYLRIVEYLRKVHGLTRAHDRTKSKFVHDMAIEMEREEAALNAKKEYKSFLWPLLSGVKARQGYTKEYICGMQIYELVHEANRLQIIIQSDALLQGSYSGMVNTKSIPKESFNWLRDIDTNKNTGQEFKEGTY